MPDSSPTIIRFWQLVSSESSVASWPATPMWRRTLAGMLYRSREPAGMARFMPAFFRDLAPCLPPSRALPALTNAAYFGGNAIALDLWVLAIWAACGVAVAFPVEDGMEISCRTGR